MYQAIFSGNFIQIPVPNPPLGAAGERREGSGLQNFSDEPGKGGLFRRSKTLLCPEPTPRTSRIIPSHSARSAHLKRRKTAATMRCFCVSLSFCLVDN